MGKAAQKWSENAATLAEIPRLSGAAARFRDGPALAGPTAKHNCRLDITLAQATGAHQRCVWPPNGAPRKNMQNGRREIRRSRLCAVGDRARRRRDVVEFRFVAARLKQGVHDRFSARPMDRSALLQRDRAARSEMPPIRFVVTAKQECAPYFGFSARPGREE